MTDQRLDQLSGLVYNYLFHLLDGEVGFTGSEAGRIAFKVETAFRNAVNTDTPMTCPNCGNESIDGDLCGDCEWQLTAAGLLGYPRIDVSLDY